MALDGQRVQLDRYTIIPRTLTFLTKADRVLLFRAAIGHDAWSGLLNGVGGHVEQGESPAEAARREIIEETGLNARDLKLCGVVIVDPGGQPGIGLFVFVGEATGELTHASEEGTPVWVPRLELKSYELVQDLYEMIPRALGCYEQDGTFSALTSFDKDGHPHLRFSS